MAVCQQICQFLGIYCFDIVTPFPKKTTKNSWEESPAASKQTRWLDSRDVCKKHLPKCFILFTYLCMNSVYNHFIFLIFGTCDAFIGQGFIYSLWSNLSIVIQYFYPLSQQACLKVACSDILLQSVPSLHMLWVVEKKLYI